MHRPIYDDSAFALYFAAEDAAPRSAPFDAALNAFFCGPLMHPDRVAALLGRTPTYAPAVAVGYTRRFEDVAGQSTAFMVPAEDDPHRLLSGVAYLDLTDADLASIETLELAGGLRRRVTIDVRVGEHPVSAVTWLAQPKPKEPKGSCLDL